MGRSLGVGQGEGGQGAGEIKNFRKSGEGSSIPFRPHGPHRCGDSHEHASNRSKSTLEAELSSRMNRHAPRTSLQCERRKPACASNLMRSKREIGSPLIAALLIAAVLIAAVLIAAVWHSAVLNSAVLSSAVLNSAVLNSESQAGPAGAQRLAVPCSRADRAHVLRSE